MGGVAQLKALTVGPWSCNQHPTPAAAGLISSSHHLAQSGVFTTPFISPTGTKAGTDTQACKGGPAEELTFPNRTEVNCETDLPGCCSLLQSHCLWTFSLDSISDDSLGAGSKQANGRLPGGLWRGHRKQLRAPFATYVTLGRQHFWPCIPYGSPQGWQRRGWFYRQGNPATEGSCLRPFTRWSWWGV